MDQGTQVGFYEMVSLSLQILLKTVYESSCSCRQKNLGRLQIKKYDKDCLLRNREEHIFCRGNECQDERSGEEMPTDRQLLMDKDR